MDRRGVLGHVVLVALALGCSSEGKSPPDASSDGGEPRDASAGDRLIVAEAAIADQRPDLPSSISGTIRGTVVADGRPLAGAIVRFGGRSTFATTDSGGRFELDVGKEPIDPRSIALTAGKTGYFTAGIAVTDPSSDQRIELMALGFDDQPQYAFKSPDRSTAAPNCIHCHQRQVSPWRGSAHSTSATNPKLHDMYNGTASGFTDSASCQRAGGRWLKGQALGSDGAAFKCYIDPRHGNVLADMNPGRCGTGDLPRCDDPDAPAANKPQLTGPCADCHAPAVTNHRGGATNINTVRGEALRSGVHCDFCHKVERVEVNDSPGVNGAIVLRRPPMGRRDWAEPEVMFGPLTDVTLTVMGNSYQPQFLESTFCSACHQWSTMGIRPDDAPHIARDKWSSGLPIQDTFREWQQSPQAKKGQQCQHCHMPAIEADTAATDITLGVDIDGVAGWPRAFGQVRSHAFAARPPSSELGKSRGANAPTAAELRSPMALTIAAKREGNTLRVDVSLKNEHAGHSIPTGTPSRALLLVVTAHAAGSELPAVGGHTMQYAAGAYLRGTLGEDGAALVNSTLTLATNQSLPPSAVGKRVRFSRATGEYHDYPATGYFAAAGRTAKEKGLAAYEPVGHATIVAITNRVVTLSHPLVVANGARYTVVDAPPANPLTMDQGIASRALSGTPGLAFTKMMRDRDANLNVPFFRAVDVVWDNRLPAGATAKTAHIYDAGTAAGAAVTVRAMVLYRKYPWQRALDRGWSVEDKVRIWRELIVAP